MSIQQRWSQMCADTIGGERFWTIAVDHRAAHAALMPLIETHVHGVVLDVGAGRLAWRTALERHASHYLSADREAVACGLSVVCDAIDGFPFADGTFDTIFCCSVLEHVTDPASALAAMARLLKPGGKIVLSVPFVYFVHGAPQDFYRFTRFGVELMAQRAGLTVQEISSSGGLAHMLMHAVSMVIAGSAGSGAVGVSIASFVSAVLWRIARLIDRLDRSGRLAQNINAVLIKE